MHVYFKTSAVMKITLLFQLFIIISSSIIYAQNISRFRGDNGQGIYNASGVPTTWMEQDFDWKVALPGKGHSSPVIWGDKIFVTSADKNSNRGRLSIRSARALLQRPWLLTVGLFSAHFPI